MLKVQTFSIRVERESVCHHGIAVGRCRRQCGPVVMALAIHRLSAVIGKVFEQLLIKQPTLFIDPMLSNNLTAYRKAQS